MSALIHFIHFADTLDNVISGMGDAQSGLINNGAAGTAGAYVGLNPAQPFRIGTEVYFPALSRSCDFGAGAAGTHTWTYYDERFNDVNVLEDITVGRYLTGLGDTDTRLTFSTANNISVVAGGFGMMDFYAVTGTPAIKVNPSAIDIDTIISANGIANALVVQGSDGKVGVGTATPGALLEVSDAVGPEMRLTGDRKSVV